MRKILPVLRMLFTTKYLVRRLQNRFITLQTRGRRFEVVVDIGTGTAPYRRIIDHAKYIGIDIEDRGGVPDVIINDINEGVTLPDNIADLVLCIEVLEHVKEPARVVRELYRITKPGGKVLFTTPMTWPEHEVPNDFFRYTRYGLEHLFRTAGFSRLEIMPSNRRWYTILQFTVLGMRGPLWAPIVLLLNAIGYLIERIDRDDTLPLVMHVVAIKW